MTVEKFYIFLDIDGVMYDWDYIKKEADKGNDEVRKLKTFKPESIDALNLLMDELRKTYRVQLVISSTWRMQLADTIRVLYKNGAHLKGAIDATPITRTPEYRALEILEYLYQRHSTTDNINLVIIDDEYFDFKKYFTQEQIIKTEMFHNALSVDMVKSFLNQHTIQTIALKNNEQPVEKGK